MGRQLNDQQNESNHRHIAPTIVRRHQNSHYIGSHSATASTVSTNSDQSGKSVICDHEPLQNDGADEMDSPYAKYSKYIQKKHDDELEFFDHMQPPPFDVMNGS